MVKRHLYLIYLLFSSASVSIRAWKLSGWSGIRDWNVLKAVCLDTDRCWTFILGLELITLSCNTCWHTAHWTDAHVPKRWDLIYMFVMWLLYHVTLMSLNITALNVKRNCCTERQKAFSQSGKPIAKNKYWMCACSVHQILKLYIYFKNVLADNILIN